MKVFLLVLALSFMGAMANEDGGDVAQLLVYKKIIADYIVEQTEFTVTCSVYNAGEGTAFDVVVQDNWPEDYFERVEGDVMTSFPSIAPGANETYNVTLKPLAAGEFTPQRAVVTYAFGPEGKMEEVSGYSTALPKFYILTPAHHERLTALYVKEWTAFSMMYAGPVVVPMVMWLIWRAKSLKVKTQ